MKIVRNYHHSPFVRFLQFSAFFLTLISCQPTDEEGSRSPETAPEASPAKKFSKIFGESIRPVSHRDPHVFPGDFDGDGVMDAMYVVEAVGMAGQVPEGVTIWDPWSRQIIPPSLNLSDRQGVSLAFLLHGGKGVSANKAYLIYDQHPISILDAGAAQNLSVLSHSSFSDEIPERGSQAKGDALAIPTEAGIDTYLYWDGMTYRFYEPEEIP